VENDDVGNVLLGNDLRLHEEIESVLEKNVVEEEIDANFWISYDVGEIFDVEVNDVGLRQNVGRPKDDLEHGLRHGQLLHHQRAF